MLVLGKQKVDVRINNQIETNFLRLPDSIISQFEHSILVQDVIIRLFCEESSGKSELPNDSNNRKELFFGWDGYAGSDTTHISTLESPIVEINPALYSLLLHDSKWLASKGKSSTGIIYMEVLSVVGSAKQRSSGSEDVQVLVEPVDYDDYDVVENNVDFLSQQILQQTRCVSVGQLFVCYINKTFARFQVLDISAKPQKMPGETGFLKLDNDVYVIVKPKIRLQQRTDLEGGGRVESVKKRSTCKPGQNGEYDTKKVYVKEKAADYCWIRYIEAPKKLHIFSKSQKQNLDKSTLRKMLVKVEECDTLVETELYLGSDIWRSFNLEMNNQELFELSYVKDLNSASEHFLKITKVGLWDKEATEAKEDEFGIDELETFFQFEKDQIMNQNELFYHKNGCVYRYGIMDSKSSPEQTAENTANYLVYEKNKTKIQYSNENLTEVKNGKSLALNLARPVFLQHANSAYHGNTELQESIIKEIDIQKKSKIMSLYGKRGIGKTHFVKNLLDVQYFRGEKYCKYVDCESLSNLKNNELSEWMIALQAQLYWYKDAVLVLDNIEKLFSSSSSKQTEDSADSNDKDMDVKTYFFIKKIQEISECDYSRRQQISVILTSEDKFKMHDYFQKFKVIDVEFFLKMLSRKDLMLFVSEKYPSLCSRLNIDVNELIHYFDGFSISDISNFIGMVEIYLEVSEKEETGKNHNGSENVTNDDKILDKVKDEYIPISMKLQKIIPKKLDDLIGWNNIGGMFDVKEIILETLEKPVKYSKVFENCPIRLRSGLLLYGYPGCGKTLVIKNIQTLFQSTMSNNSNKINFININGPEILNKYIGSSEKNIRDVFEKARSLKPCIIFFDEFDSIAPHRGHDSTGVTDRVVNQLLTELDGVEGGGGGGGESKGQVYVIAATSRPELIDAALLRPGRLDKSILVDLPNVEECRDILLKVFQNYENTLKDDNESITQVCEHLVRNHFTGADIQNIVYNAYLEAIHEHDVKKKANTSYSNSIVVDKTHLMNTIKKSSSSISQKELIKYKHIYNKFDNSKTNQTDKNTESVSDVGSRVSLG